jgi:sigma-54 specific flagellar transcriptional regulator A
MTNTHNRDIFSYQLFSDGGNLCQELINVFAFMGIALIESSLADCANITLETLQADAIIIGNLDPSSDATMAAKQHAFSKLADIPVLLLGNKLEADLKAPSLIGQINAPIEQTQLLPLLSRCQRFRALDIKEAMLLDDNLSALVGESDSIKNIRQLITQVAGSDINVLVLGESGTGKEIIASCIHAMSKRMAKMFVPLNCGAIPGELMESELFGHEKGAFTGALTQRKGRFELANNGTFFLDEIGDMPLAMQVKLLRVLQEQRFERVGGNTSIEVDVRIIAATHRNLETAIEEGTFREDLYYRLNVFPIAVPPLRARKEDIPVLIEHFCNDIQQRTQETIHITDAAMTQLMAYQWPGNIRELLNFVERMMVLYPNAVVDIADLDAKYLLNGVQTLVSQPTTLSTANISQPISLPNTPGQVENLKDYLANMEVKIIKESLNNNQGVISRAAKELSVCRTTLVEKMRKYNIVAR